MGFFWSYTKMIAVFKVRNVFDWSDKEFDLKVLSSEVYFEEKGPLEI